MLKKIIFTLNLTFFLMLAGGIYYINTLVKKWTIFINAFKPLQNNIGNVLSISQKYLNILFGLFLIFIAIQILGLIKEFKQKK